jgi:hypothetical protein
MTTAKKPLRAVATIVALAFCVFVATEHSVATKLQTRSSSSGSSRMALRITPRCVVLRFPQHPLANRNA